MSKTSEFKEGQFNRQRQQLIDSRLSTAREDSLICPLCWQETSFDDLTIEHVIPYEVGGRAKVLTCKACNNGHGSRLDAHLSGYMKDVAAAAGNGTVPIDVHVDGHRLAVDLATKDGFKLQVVEKATNPAAVEAAKKSSFEKMELTLRSQFIPSSLRLGILRAAYLSLFDCFGYEILVGGMQEVRQRLTDSNATFPPIEPLVVWLKGFEPNRDSHYFIWDFKINGVCGSYVILRLRLKIKEGTTTKYVAAFMPTLEGDTREFHALIGEYSKRGSSAGMRVPAECLTDERH